jgi:RHS repeat-associated protein
LNQLAQSNVFPTQQSVPVTDGSGIPTGQTYEIPGIGCAYYYDSPVVLKRFVSYNGCSGGSASNPCFGTEQEEQDFSYCTVWVNGGPTVPGCPAPSASGLGSSITWAQKTTTVITHDNVQNTTQQTVYTYSPALCPLEPNSTDPLCRMPMESQIQSFDINGGSILKTVNKQFNGDYLMKQQVTTLPTATNNVTESDWTYSTDGNDLLQTKYDYDFGTGSHGALLRETDIPSYATFSGPTHLVDKPNSVVVKDGTGSVAAGVSYIYDSGNNTIGNLTNRRNWLSSTGTSYVETQHTYWPWGAIETTTDPNGNSTTYSYADSWVASDPMPCSHTSPSNAYLTQIVYPTVNGVPHTENFTYHCATGDLATSQDENSQITTYKYGTAPYGCSQPDYFNRLTETDSPDGGVTTHCYDDPAGTTTTSVLMSGSAYETSTSYVDGMGHPIRSVSPAGSYIDTAYDGTGRPFIVTNPYQPTFWGGVSSPTPPVTTFIYDGLGRKASQLQPDGLSTLTWQYKGQSVDSWDEAGVHMRHTSDALGRLTQVTELGAGDALNLHTIYTYDPLGNLLSVNQQGATGDTPRNRMFAYDSLSRLTQACNPEGLPTGTSCDGSHWSNLYTYDPNSNLHTKTDARGITVTYSNYDGLNRVHLKTYSNNEPPEGFGYDGNDWAGNPLPPNYTATSNVIGRLTYASHFGQGDVGYEYNPMGRVLEQSYCLPSDCGNRHYVNAAYDLAGNMTDLTYPDGRHIQQTFDSAGRVAASNQVDTTGTPIASYLQGVTYWPDSSPYITTLGNGVQQTIAKNTRLQVQNLSVTDPLTSQTFLAHTYCYNSTCGTANNNGNILQIIDTLNPANTQGFGYDSLNRINTFSLNGTPNQQFNIDSFGNMAQTLNTSWVPTFDPTTNRINNLPCASSITPYDAAGNQQCSTDSNGAVSNYVYDAESRISAFSVFPADPTTSPSETYVYGADGTRVRKTQGLLTDPNAPYTEYVNFNGQPIAERDQNGNWTDYVYANGKKIAMVPSEELHLKVTADAGNGNNWLWIDIGGLDGYIVQPGDKLSWRQFQSSTAHGGIYLATTNGGPGTTWTDLDQNGNYSNSSPVTGVWESRVVDVSNLAGYQIWLTGVGFDGYTTGSGSSIEYADIALSSNDGQVHTIYNGQAVATGAQYGCCMANVQTVNVVEALSGQAQQSAIHYYLGDHLGTAQLELSSGGWPVWQGHFAPYGQELQGTALLPPDLPDGSNNHYKFTGKERDTESGLDYFGARYYGSNMGRFMSPDWADKPEAVPYSSLSDPQTLNLYGYMRNNPLGGTDKDGHCGQQQSGGTTCPTVTVTATPATQPAPVHTTTVTDTQGNQHTVTGPNADIHFTVSANGTPAAGVKVTETNQSTTQAGTQTINGKPIEGSATSNASGGYKDTVGAGLPSSTTTPAAAASAYNSTPVTITDTQTQTLTLPGGCTCTATSTRVVTNTTDGKTISPGGYTLTTTQPVVSTPKPPQQPQ